VFAGDPLRAHRAGVSFVARTLLQEIGEPVDAVITTSAGYPLDLTYYQTIKGITAASHIVREGGRILLAGACDEGPGGAEFVRLMREYRDPAAFMAAIEGTEVTIDQWQLEKLALVQRRAEVSYYVPGLSDDIRGLLWGRAYAGIDDAVRALLSGLDRNARVAVIPEGPYVLAKVGAALAA
jgi:nickel-dependent lactate racemase